MTDYLQHALNWIDRADTADDCGRPEDAEIFRRTARDSATLSIAYCLDRIATALERIAAVQEESHS